MRYGVTIYGPLVDNWAERQTLTSLLGTAFPCSYEQIRTVWNMMQNFPDLNNVQVVMKTSGDLLVHVYCSPVNVPEDADCVFHAKISRSGTYA